MSNMKIRQIERQVNEVSNNVLQLIKKDQPITIRTKDKDSPVNTTCNSYKALYKAVQELKTNQTTLYNETPENIMYQKKMIGSLLNNLYKTGKYKCGLIGD